MIIFKKEQDLRAYLADQNTQGRLIAFVPTMGALHAGHRSLVIKAKESGALVVCSIFINPTQFNNTSDFEKYPIAREEDMLLLIEAGCDVAFIPEIDDMYPDGTEKMASFDFGYLDTILEGAHRPGHFKGVGQIVARLLDIINPQLLYLGQKDYQQIMVVRKLLEQTGKQDQVKIVVCPTVREEDGLAMSSRNMRLTEPQRALAGIIYQCLVSIQTKQTDGNFQLVQKQCMELLKDKGFQPEYVELADSENLTILEEYRSDKPMVALVAAKIGDVRLIDNLLLN
jgi:pantoate--beta-alanine ligase